MSGSQDPQLNIAAVRDVYGYQPGADSFKSDAPAAPDSIDRYSRQIRFSGWGVEAQKRLGESTVALIGCGALGTSLADTLVRAGVGKLLLFDRDFIEWNNLQRQVLFDEEDVKAGLPKAEAAARKLRRINSGVAVEAEILDIHAGNIEAATERAELLLDGTDNFDTRYLINDLAVKTGRPWIYGAVVGGGGLAMPIWPGETLCLRCLFDAPPPPEHNPTCESTGVMAPAVKLIAAIQAAEALKLLGGLRDRVSRRLFNIDLWNGSLRAIDFSKQGPSPDCVCCGKRQFEYLDRPDAGRTATLCGRNAVQVRPAHPMRLDLAAMEAKLVAALGPLANAALDHPSRPTAVKRNEFLLQITGDSFELTLFKDGRAIFKGVTEPERGRALYARYVGE